MAASTSDRLKVLEAFMNDMVGYKVAQLDLIEDKLDLCDTFITKHSPFLDELVEKRLPELDKLLNDKIPELEGLIIKQSEHFELLGSAVEDLREAIPDESVLKEEVDYIHIQLDELRETQQALKDAIGRGASGLNVRRKIKPPAPQSFAGARNAKEIDNFVFDMEQYFEALELENNMKVVTAAMYLVDDAKLWWRSKHAAIQAGTITLSTWEEFKIALKEQFYPENAAFLARRRLKTIKHVSSIREYVNAFATCMLDIDDMSEPDKMFAFLDGLKEWAQREVNRQRHVTLTSMMTAAERIVDYVSEREPAQKKGQTGSNANSKTSGNGSYSRSSPAGSNRSRAGGEGQRRGYSNNFNNSSRASEASSNWRKNHCYLCGGEHRMHECPHALTKVTSMP